MTVQRRWEMNVPLAPLTTLGVGGPARFMAQVVSEGELEDSLRRAKAEELEVTVLGGGSNIVIADRGFDGLVLRMTSKAANTTSDGEDVLVTADAGMVWDDLVAFSVELGLVGIETLSGIPGSVGAAPIQNIGAYGQEIADCLVEMRVFDCAEDRWRDIEAADCGFGYRKSRFKLEPNRQTIASKIVLRLKAVGRSLISYEQLKKRLDSSGVAGCPNPVQVREAVLELRREKGMLLDPMDPNSKSAGSFFVNPSVSAAKADELRELARRSDNNEMPRYPGEGGTVKLSAGWLIERSGIARGHVAGAVGLSERHALAIINRGGAGASDVIALATEVRRRVFEQHGVLLQVEPVLLGFEPHEVAALVGEDS